MRVSCLEIALLCEPRDDNSQQLLMVINMLGMIVDGKLKVSSLIHHTHNL